MLIGQFADYKHFVGSIEYSPKDACYYGRLQNSRDIVSYKGDTIEELFQNYKDTIDEYLLWIVDDLSFEERNHEL